MKELYIDFDGVILDTMTSSYEVLAKQGIKPTDTDKVSEYYTSLDWKEFLECTPVINDGLTCIERIINSGLFSVSILTHVTTLDEAIEKVKYIRKFFKDITIIPVPKKISKTKMVHTEGAVLIDDYVHNLKEWEEAGGIGVRFSTKLSGKGYAVIDRLDQILELGLV